MIFGNARAGTPLMQATQTIGIDLPLKALVGREVGATAGAMTAALAEVARSATG